MPELSEYELRHLIAHLRSASRLDAIDDLLSVYSADGANFWFAEKDRRGDQDGYSNDLRTALDTAIESLHRADGADIGVLTGSIMRYCICLATLNEFAGTISAGVLKELVRRNLWKPRAIFDYATRLPWPDRRIASLCTIFPHLDSADQAECYFRASEALLNLDSMSGTPSTLVYLHHQAIARMGSAFVEGGRYDLVIRLCIDCHSLPTRQELVGSVARLLNSLPDSVAEEAHRCAESWFKEARTLLERSCFLNLVNDSERIGCLQGLVVALRTRFTNFYESVTALERIQAHLSVSQFQSIVQVTYVRAMGDDIERRRVDILVRLLPFLDGPNQKTALDQVLPFIEKAECADDELQSLLTRLCGIPDLDRSAILGSIGRIANAYMRSVQMATTFPIQSATERDQSVKNIAEVVSWLGARGDSWSAEQLLLTLSQAGVHLDGPHKAEVLHLVRAMTDQKLRIRSLTALLPHMSDTNLDDVISGELETVKNIDSPDVVEQFCSAAASVASTKLIRSMPQLLRVATNRGWFLVGLGRALDYFRGGSRSEELFSWIVGAVRYVPEPTRYNCLISIAGYLPVNEENSVFETARTLSDSALRLECCSKIARFSGSDHLLEELRRLLDLELGRLEEPRQRAVALTRVLNIWPPLPMESLIGDALDSISLVEYPTHRAQLLALVGPWGGQRAQSMRSDLVKQMFGSVKEVVARDVLRALAPSLETIVVDSMLRRVLRCSDDNLRLEALPEILARKATLGGHREAFEIAAKQKPQVIREGCLVAVVLHLDANLLGAAAKAYMAIENSYFRDRALSGFCIRASQLRFEEHYGYVSFIQDPSQRAPALCALAKAASGDQEQKLLDQAFQSFESVNQRMRGSLIDPLVQSLVMKSRGHDLVRSFLRLVGILVNESREELGPHVYALAPLLHVLGGVEAVERTMLAVRDVARWWP